MTSHQRNRRKAIRQASTITGALFLSIIFFAPAIGGLITQ
jgi:hypothetical protein